MSYDNIEIVIPEVNSDTGLNLCRRNKKIYIQSLRLFASNIPANIAKMRAILQEGDFSEGNLKTYKINVHSIKGMCVYIGAEEAEKTAKKLENIADNGDVKSIKEQNEAFMQYVEKIISHIKSWLDNANLEQNDG